MALTTPVCDDDIFSREAVRNARAVDDGLREMGPVVKLARENITMIARHAHVPPFEALDAGARGLLDQEGGELARERRLMELLEELRR